MTLDHLLFAAGLSVYVCVFGGQLYEEYSERVGTIVPTF